MMKITTRNLALRSATYVASATRLGCSPSTWLVIRRRWNYWLALCAGLVTSVAAGSPPLPPLTTASGNPRLPGKLVWADLVTDDVLTARKFYAQLFGWKFWELGGYSIALNDGRPLGGIFQRPRPKDRTAEPRWFGYISVASVERAQRAATNAGA